LDDKYERLNYINNFLSKYGSNAKPIAPPELDFSAVVSKTAGNFGVFLITSSWGKMSDEKLVIISFVNPCGSLIVEGGKFEEKSLNVEEFHLDSHLFLVKVQKSVPAGTGFYYRELVYVALEEGAIGKPLVQQNYEYLTGRWGTLGNGGEIEITLKDKLVERERRLFLEMAGFIETRDDAGVNRVREVEPFVFEWVPPQKSFRQIGGRVVPQQGDLLGAFVDYADKAGEWLEKPADIQGIKAKYGAD
jgi:hypothetical protein